MGAGWECLTILAFTGSHGVGRMVFVGRASADPLTSPTWDSTTALWREGKVAVMRRCDGRARAADTQLSSAASTRPGSASRGGHAADDEHVKLFDDPPSGQGYHGTCKMATLR